MIDQVIKTEYDKIWSGFLDRLMSFQEEYLSQAIAEGNIHDFLYSIQYVPERQLNKIVEQIRYDASFFFDYTAFYAVAQCIKSKIPDVEYRSVTGSKVIRLSSDSELCMYHNNKSVIFKFDRSLSLKYLKWAEEQRSFLLPYRIKYYFISASAHVEFDEIDAFSKQQVACFLRSSYADRIKSWRVDELIDDACKFLNS